MQKKVLRFRRSDLGGDRRSGAFWTMWRWWLKMQRPARQTTVIRIALHLRGRQGDLLHCYTEYRRTRLYPRTSTDKATKGLLNRIKASEGDGQSQCQDAKRTPGTRRDRDKVTHSVRTIHPRGEQGKNWPLTICVWVVQWHAVPTATFIGNRRCNVETSQECSRIHGAHSRR